MKQQEIIAYSKGKVAQITIPAAVRYPHFGKYHIIANSRHVRELANYVFEIVEKPQDIDDQDAFDLYVFNAAVARLQTIKSFSGQYKRLTRYIEMLTAFLTASGNPVPRERRCSWAWIPPVGNKRVVYSPEFNYIMAPNAKLRTISLDSTVSVHIDRHKRLVNYVLGKYKSEPSIDVLRRICALKNADRMIRVLVARIGQLERVMVRPLFVNIRVSQPFDGTARVTLDHIPLGFASCVTLKPRKRALEAARTLGDHLTGLNEEIKDVTWSDIHLAKANLLKHKYRPQYKNILHDEYAHCARTNTKTA